MPDGCHAVTGSDDGTAKIWDLATGEQLHALTGHTDRVVAVAVTPGVATFVADAPIHNCAVSEGRILAAGAVGRLHVLQLVARQGGSVP